MKDNQELAKDYTDWLVKTGGFARDITLRDHFAGLAMQGLAHEVFDPENLAICAYEQADEMLKARSAPND
jgi:hypothetical protein